MQYVVLSCSARGGFLVSLYFRSFSHGEGVHTVSLHAELSLVVLLGLFVQRVHLVFSLFSQLCEAQFLLLTMKSHRDLRPATKSFPHHQPDYKQWVFKEHISEELRVCVFVCLCWCVPTKLLHNFFSIVIFSVLLRVIWFKMMNVHPTKKRLQTQIAPGGPSAHADTRHNRLLHHF